MTDSRPRPRPRRTAPTLRARDHVSLRDRVVRSLAVMVAAGLLLVVVAPFSPDGWLADGETLRSILNAVGWTLLGVGTYLMLPAAGLFQDR